ncbi:hypothetical protein AAFF_G00400680 [Aldrovandia affinis]|uniref:Uncharacterized protein n=1 Tax=Aldrovandia affinis TaxID=143900 RepID=A0AAD7SCI0_9TELE|nr:hypothetical protein AAFF_G00400680 [Aldrovandia affinis]
MQKVRRGRLLNDDREGGHSSNPRSRQRHSAVIAGVFPPRTDGESNMASSRAEALSSPATCGSSGDTKRNLGSAQAGIRGPLAGPARRIASMSLPHNGGVTTSPESAGRESPPTDSVAAPEIV